MEITPIFELSQFLRSLETFNGERRTRIIAPSEVVAWAEELLRSRGEAFRMSGGWAPAYQREAVTTIVVLIRKHEMVFPFVRIGSNLPLKERWPDAPIRYATVKEQFPLIWKDYEMACESLVPVPPAELPWSNELSI